MPGPRGRAPTSSAYVGVLNATIGSAVRDHAVQQREGAVVQLHHHALERLLGFLVRDFQHLQDHRLVLAEHFAAGDAETAARSRSGRQRR